MKVLTRVSENQVGRHTFSQLDEEFLDRAITARKKGVGKILYLKLAGHRLAQEILGACARLVVPLA